MQMMTWAEFLIVFGCCTVAILVCRVVPLFALKGREIPQKVQRALKLIPPAAFAALVANDIYNPGMFDGGLWPASAPIVAAIVVVIVALKTKSLLLCSITGVAVYALLIFIF